MTGEVIASGAQWAGILPHKGQGQFSLIMTVKGSIIHRKAKQSKEGNHGTGSTTAPSPSVRTGLKRVGLIYYRKETLLQSYLDILGGINGRHALLQTVST